MSDETKAIYKARREAHKTEGMLAATFREAMRIWDAQKAEGVSIQDRINGLERTLRVAWPQTRAWKYLCADCSDRGLEMRECPGDRVCGRDGPHLAHEFGVACHCSAGNRFRQADRPAEDFSKATKGRPAAKGFSKSWSR